MHGNSKLQILAPSNGSPSNTSITLPPGTYFPYGLNISANFTGTGQPIVFPPGYTLNTSLTLPNGLVLSNYIVLPSGSILQTAIVLAPGTVLQTNLDLTGGVSLPDGLQLDGGTYLPNGISIPGGTFLPDGITIPGDTTLPNPFTIPGNTTLPEDVVFGNFTTPNNFTVPNGTQINSPVTFPQGTVLSAGISIASGTTLSSGLSIPQGTVLPDGISLASGTTLSSGLSIPQGTVLPDGISLASGTVLTNGITIPGGTVLTDGISLASGTVLVNGLVIPEGTILPDGIALSGQVTLPNGLVIAGGTTLPTGISLPSGVSLPDGLTLPIGTFLPYGLSIPQLGINIPAGTTLSSVLNLNAGTVLSNGLVLPGGTVLSGSGLTLPGGVTLSCTGLITGSGTCTSLTLPGGFSIGSGGLTLPGGVTLSCTGLITGGTCTGLTLPGGFSIGSGGLTLPGGTTLSCTGLFTGGTCTGLTLPGGFSIGTGGLTLPGGITVSCSGLIGGGVGTCTGLTLPGGISISVNGITLPGGITISPSGLTLPGGITLSPSGLTLPGGITLSPSGLTLPGGITLSPSGLTLPGGITIPGLSLLSGTSLTSGLGIGSGTLAQALGLSSGTSLISSSSLSNILGGGPTGGVGGGLNGLSGLGGIGVSAGQCGTAQTKNGFGVCVWYCTPLGCNIEEVITTIYPHLYLGTSSIPQPTTYTTSPVNSILNYNYNSAPYYITCPLAPPVHPKNQTYFYTGADPYVAGNACFNQYYGPLVTTITLPSKFNNLIEALTEIGLIATPYLVTETALPLKVNNVGVASEKSIAYSPEVNNNVSDAFSAEFYIFQHSPAFTQHGIWTWTGNIADFANAPSNAIATDSFKNLYWMASIQIAGVPIPSSCVYRYSYKANLKLVGINNNYIPFNVIVGNFMASNSMMPANQIQFAANVLPYLTYQYALGSFGGQTFKIGYSIYNPSTYYNPYDLVDQFPINSTGLFFATYPKSMFPGSGKNGGLTFLEQFQTQGGFGVNALTATNVLVIGQPSSTLLGCNGSACPYFNPVGSGCTLGRTDQGKDYGGSCNLYAIGSGTVVGTFNSGWPGDAFIAIDLDNPLPAADCAGSYSDFQSYSSPFSISSSSFTSVSSCSRVYYAEDINPSVTIGEHVSACQVIGTATGGQYGIELGWADPAAFGDSLFAYQTHVDYVNNAYTGGDSGATPEGTAYFKWISGLTNCGGSTSTPQVPPLPTNSSGQLSSSTSNSSAKSIQQLQQTTGGSNVNGDQFFSGVLQDMGVPVTRNNINFLEVFAQAESGQSQGLADWNPLNTELSTAGATCNANSAGVKEYDNAADGESALAQTLDQSYYSALVQGLQSNQPISYYATNPSAQQAINVYQTGSPVGTSSDAAEFQSVNNGGFASLNSVTSYWDSAINAGNTPCYSYPTGGSSGSTSSAQPSTYTDTPTVPAPTFYTLANPISIAVTPNNYVYILNWSPMTQESNNVKGAYFLNIFRVFPQGRYNMSLYPPNVVGSVSCLNTDTNCNINKQWTQTWDQYWANTILIQQNETQFLKSIDLTAKTGGSVGGGIFNIGAGQVFQALNITTDNAGDVYISGANTVACRGSSQYSSAPACGSGWNLVAPSIPEIVKISNPAASKFTISTNTLYQIPVPEASVPEVTSSPDGTEVFLAGAGNGYIYVVDGQSLSYVGNTISLSFSKSEGSTTIGVNVLAYFANGGLYNDSIPAASNAGGASGSYNQFDVNSFHHPLGIQDINGYLYVLDNWQGQIGNLQFSELLYRVINTTGYDVPLNPTLSDNIYQETSCTFAGQSTGYYDCISSGFAKSLSCSPGCVSVPGSTCSVAPGEAGLAYACVPEASVATASPSEISPLSSQYTSLAAQTSSTPQNIYPPYGWVISANVSTGSSGMPVATFCSSSATSGSGGAGCMYTPNHMPANYHGNYEPVGPALASSGLSASPGLAYSVSANATTTIIFPAAPALSFWTKLWNGFTCFEGFYCAQSDLNQYQELLFVNFNVQNYTNFQSDQGAYECYIGSKQIAQSSACNGEYANNAKFLSDLNNMSAPIYFFSDPFKNLISIGSPSLGSYQSSLYQVLSVNGIIGGSGQFNSQNIQECAAAFSNSMVKGCPIQSNALSASNTIGGFINSNALSISSPQNQQQTLSTQIYGRLLVPYEYQFSIQQFYTGFVFVGSALGPTVSALCAAATPALNAYFTAKNAQQIAMPPTYTVYYYAQTKNATSNNLSVPVEGGYSYITPFGNSGNRYYQPNLSDYGLIISPQLLYLLHSNREISDLYINITPWSNSLISSIGGGLGNIGGIGGLGNIGNIASGSQSSGQYVINASLLYNYMINLNIQNGALLGSLSGGGLTGGLGGGTSGLGSIAGLLTGSPLGGYETISAKPLKQQEYGQKAYSDIACGSSTLSSIIGGIGSGSINPNGILSSVACGLAGSRYATANTAFNYTQSNTLNFVDLFGIYQNLTYLNTMFLFLNSSTYSANGASLLGNGGSSLGNILGLLNGQSLLGYNRLIYVLNDRFNNSIYAPFDADIANTTQISLSVVPNVSASNPNQTTLQITGTAGYYTRYGTNFVPLPNAQIYLYYGADINYVNYNPTVSPANAMLCAFGFGAYSINAFGLGIDTNKLPTPQECQLANPAFTAQQANALQVTYHAQSGLSSSGATSCPAAPNSLLEAPTYNCNIYGIQDLPQTCTSARAGQEYCVPVYSNGTGICTSQVGLINPGSIPISLGNLASPIAGAGPYVTTNSAGAFSANIVACGIGNAKIIATFYGLPQNEPVQVTQPLLGYSAQPNPPATIGTSNTYATFNVIDFTWAPNTTSKTTQIGLFELSYGDIDALAAVVAAVAAILIVAYVKLSKQSRRKGQGKKARR